MDDELLIELVRNLPVLYDTLLHPSGALHSSRIMAIIAKSTSVNFAIFEITDHGVRTTESPRICMNRRHRSDTDITERY
ncbi:hypothetical protein E2C01_001135 [Portunus trituberculatus]|uniref:Uncharacterized protein n=1 Tax=Portunus trituberculatus TaxID=210409 RepID=A0A5B7CJN4_PORTR|nr:hypothetical protein [Portunus trituberculatus]